MTDFVDFTNVTELERFTAKLAKKSVENLNFKGVEFEILTVQEQITQNEYLNSLPYFQYESKSGPGRWFNLGQYKHLHCADRMISEPTGRLLLSSILMSSQSLKNPVFLQIGESSWLGIENTQNEIILFEAGPVKSFKIGENVSSALSILQWNIPPTLAIKFPKWIGYFHDFCPVNRVQITVTWPKIRPNTELDLITAPIWTASFSEVSHDKRLPMRGQMQRVLLNGHLREVFSEEEASLPALLNVPIFGALNETAEIAAYKQALNNASSERLLDELYRIIGAIYGNEVKRMESEGWSSTGGSGLGPLVWQNMRMTRITEKISLCWRQFVQIQERRWENLKWEGKREKPVNELEEQLALLDWCIARELEWRDSLAKAGFDWSKLLPSLPIFNLAQKTTDLNTEIEKLSEGIERKVALKEAVEEDETVEELKEEAGKESNDTTNSQRLKLLKHDFNFKNEIWIPVTLNCQPPPPNFTLPPSAPLAGDVVALAQLRSDMAAFKAANQQLLENEEKAEEEEEEEEEEAFTAFLIWHSPNDVEQLENGQLKVSSRMLDPTGQWQQLWREVEAQPLNPQTFRHHVSFNHRSLAGQLLSDWACKFTLKNLLEAAIPSIIKNMSQKQVELMKLLGIEQDDYKDLFLEVPFPLDKLSEKLDAGEAEISKQLALRQLNLKGKESECDWLVVDEAERRSLLQQGSFELAFEERIGPDWYYCNEDGGFLARKRTINLAD